MLFFEQFNCLFPEHIPTFSIHNSLQSHRSDAWTSLFIATLFNVIINHFMMFFMQFLYCFPIHPLIRCWLWYMNLMVFPAYLSISSRYWLLFCLMLALPKTSTNLSRRSVSFLFHLSKGQRSNIVSVLFSSSISLLSFVYFLDFFLFFFCNSFFSHTFVCWSRHPLYLSISAIV